MEPEFSPGFELEVGGSYGAVIARPYQGSPLRDLVTDARYEAPSEPPISCENVLLSG